MTPSQIFEEDKQKVFEILKKHQNRFISVSDIADKAGVSLSRTLDCLVALSTDAKARQDAGGWSVSK